jgi:hypothetical protein
MGYHLPVYHHCACFVPRFSLQEYGAYNGEMIPSRKRLVRLDNAKVNLISRAAPTNWFRPVGTPLRNGTEPYPNGDNIQTVEPWLPPDLFGGTDTAAIDTILHVIDAGISGGPLYSDHNKAGDREAW